MKKLNLTIVFILCVFAIKAQIKVWPGGSTSIGTTTNAPSGSNRTLLWGPVNIQQSNVDQHLLIFNLLNI